MRALFLLRLGESENVEAPEKSDFRLSLLKQSEEALRTSLKNLSLAEEIYFIKEKLDNLN